MPQQTDFSAEIVENSEGQRVFRSIQYQKLQFPLDQLDYKGEIKFRPFKRQPVNVAGIASEVSTFARNYPDRIANFNEGLVPDATEEFLRSAGIGDEQIQQINSEQNRQMLGEAFSDPVNLVKEYEPVYCSMYMPQAVQFRDLIRYNDMSIGAGGAAAFGALQAGQGVIGAGIAGVQGSLSAMTSNPGQAANTPQARLALSALGSRGNAQIQGATRLATQVSVNPNQRTLFEAPSIRDFSFTFKLIPTSLTESREINKIINFFRRQMYPERISLGDNGFAVGYEFPSLFDISFLYNGSPLPNTEMLPCYLFGMDINLNPTNQAFHSNGRGGEFNEVELVLNFREERAPDKNDFNERNQAAFTDVPYNYPAPAVEEQADLIQEQAFPNDNENYFG